MKAGYNRVEELPLILTPENVGMVLGISRNNAYAVVHSKGFPVLKIGKQYRIHRDRFFEWIEATQEVEIAS